MRFMMLMIPRGYESAEPGAMPSAEAVAAMMKYNEELQKAGVLLALDGLHPTTSAVRVRLDSGKKKVVDGPFTEAKEIVGGYWILQTRTREEAIEWARRVPLDPGSFVELRQIFEMTDFPEDIQRLNKPLAEKLAKQ